MPVPLSRRSLLAAAGLSSAGMAALTACGAPPEELAPEPDVAVLLGAIADEENLISLYEKISSAHGELPSACAQALANHREHLAVLRRHYLPGTGGATSTPAAAGSAPAEPPADRAGALALLRRTERAAAGARLRDVAAVSPGMSQLLASIGACEAGHATALALT
ncbi:hypothetical protein LO762_31235 [Actinocorallia sp. API 0066]|uniref:hypothetical protein n=1 Tax=Actinocorallia sp. API 0066 TaxID=2896846 RepID=UPI001E5BE34F|nr:hypothetical protein [Actinocorallia sp. API 0066]MCD0453626.1 hypothetical protein [Actinocorallia sp. API 0066]